MFQRYANTILQFRQKSPTRKLLHDFCGHLEPGELLMVIGRPGSGCTSFLKSLCHLHEEYIGTNGSIMYSGKQANFKATDAPAETTFCGMLSQSTQGEADSHSS